MIIDYNTMKEEVIPNFKGGEGEMVTRMFNDELNKIMNLLRQATTMDNGKSSGRPENTGG